MKVRMARTITPKQKKFADLILDGKPKVQAALAAYDTKDYKTASVIGAENFEKPRVLEYLAQHAEAVASNMVKLALTAKNQQVQVNAGKDVLDRAGYKPVDKSQNQNVNVNIDVTQENTDALTLAQEYEAKLRKQLQEAHAAE
jgi:phage terminase small subunit